MLRPWLLPSLLVVGLVPVAAQRAADSLATAVVERLMQAQRFLSSAPSPAPEALELDEDPTVFGAAAVVTSPASQKVAAKRPAKPSSVFVSAAQVLAIADTGARPRGKPVPATARRPAGLKLSGVSALGLGVRDGDVLTEAAGAPALDSGAVIEAVLRARARQAKAISGTCYRGDERYSLVVEQPYLPVRGKVRAEP